MAEFKPQPIPWKRADETLFFGIDYTEYPLPAGTVIVSSNLHGSLTVTAEDTSGNDITGDVLLGAPGISNDGDTVLIQITAGTEFSIIWFLCQAPTSDDQFFTERFYMEVRP